MAWVENGEAPETLTGTKFVNVSPAWKVKTGKDGKTVLTCVIIGHGEPGSGVRPKSLQVSVEESLHGPGQLRGSELVGVYFVG